MHFLLTKIFKKYNLLKLKIVKRTIKRKIYYDLILP